MSAHAVRAAAVATTTTKPQRDRVRTYRPHHRVCATTAARPSPRASAAPRRWSADAATTPSLPLRANSRGDRIAVHAGAAAATPPTKRQPGESLNAYSVVMKFGGSSVADAARMREVADIILAFPDELPVIVLSAMGKSTNNLIEAGELAAECGADAVASLAPIARLRDLHREAMDDLRVDDATRDEVDALLDEMQRLCAHVADEKKLTPRNKDALVSFGERMSTRIFSAYLRSIGIASEQRDAFDIGLTTTDDFGNGNIVDVTYDLVASAFAMKPGADSKRVVPIVTGFLGRGEKTGLITTLGRGGSDLTATVIGAALNVPEVQVWKDVDGVLSADPREIDNTAVLEFLTFEEATELAYFGAQVLHPQSMRPAMDKDGLSVRVKNSYNVTAPGTLIGHARPRGDDDPDWMLTSIVQKKSITMLDIVSTRMLGQYGFLATVFEVMERNKISVDCVATSEVSVSLTLDPAKMWSRDLVEEELEALVRDFEENGIARVTCQTGHSLISLIGNVRRNKEIVQRSFAALERADVTVKMISQGASKTNISLLVNGDEGTEAVRAIHAEFFT